MRAFVVMLAVAAGLLGSSAFAQKLNSDDLKWVNRCIVDNKGGVASAVIRNYCLRMNEKMDDNETQSIST